MAGFGTGAPAAFGAAWYLDAQTSLAMALGIAGSAPGVARLARRLDAGVSDAPAGATTFLFGAAKSAALVGLLAACAMYIAASTYNPFIYFRF
jgi:alginate O-acetyltransferase complex protein AlgI